MERNNYGVQYSWTPHYQKVGGQYTITTTGSSPLFPVSHLHWCRQPITRHKTINGKHATQRDTKTRRYVHCALSEDANWRRHTASSLDWRLAMVNALRHEFGVTPYTYIHTHTPYITN